MFNLTRWRTFRARGALLTVVLIAQGCMTGDPATRMIAKVDSMPPEDRPYDWERTKALMSRTPPEIGAVAPDFALTRLESSEPLRLSTYAPGQPKVLIFASFT